jgi:hypothetical protein
VGFVSYFILIEISDLNCATGLLELLDVPLLVPEFQNDESSTENAQISRMMLNLRSARTVNTDMELTTLSQSTLPSMSTRFVQAAQETQLDLRVIP